MRGDPVGGGEAFLAAELAARDSYGRLLAYLAARCRDLAAAEDALSDAFCSALRAWPRTGVPERPEAWLLTAARRRLVDHHRRLTVEGEAAPQLAAALADAQVDASGRDVFPDERLKLLFACAHPAIDESARTPLMLQIVLGLDAGRIGSAFVVSPAAMSQRLVRAKSKIRDARIRFEIPDLTEWRARMHSVLEAIYAAYGTAWDDIAGADAQRRGLASQAIWFGRLAAALVPDDAEAQGLLALMLHCEARRAARRTSSGAYVPLDRQDVGLWSRPMIDEAERVLVAAAACGRPGRFQLEAAIQSVHAHRAVTHRTDWEAIALLYAGLLQIAPTVGARVGYAAALAETRGPAVSLDELERVPAATVTTYQPYWALRASLLARAGSTKAAREAYARAIGLSEDGAVRAFLLEEAARLSTA